MPNGALRLRGAGARGLAGSPSQPRLLRFSPHAVRQRSIVACDSSMRVRPSMRRPSAVTSIEPTDSTREARSPSRTSPSASHGGLSSIASCTRACTRSFARTLRPPRISAKGQPACAHRSVRTTSTSARPSAPSASAAIASSSRSKRTRHSSARATSPGSCSASARASAASPPPIRPMRASRSRLRTSPGSAAGFVGGGGVARRISPIAAAGSADRATGCPDGTPESPPSRSVDPRAACCADRPPDRASKDAHRTPSINASRTSSAQARSRSTSLASTAAATRAPAGVERPTRSACQVEAPRGGTGVRSASMSTSRSPMTSHASTGESSPPSCHAAIRSAATASAASDSTTAAASSAASSCARALPHAHANASSDASTLSNTRPTNT